MCHLGAGITRHSPNTISSVVVHAKILMSHLVALRQQWLRRALHHGQRWHTSVPLQTKIRLISVTKPHILIWRSPGSPVPACLSLSATSLVPGRWKLSSPYILASWSLQLQTSRSSWPSLSRAVWSGRAPWQWSQQGSLKNVERIAEYSRLRSPASFPLHNIFLPAYIFSSYGVYWPWPEYQRCHFLPRTTHVDREHRSILQKKRRAEARSSFCYFYVETAVTVSSFYSSFDKNLITGILSSTCCNGLQFSGHIPVI